MERRDFLAQTAAAVSATLLLGSFRTDRYDFVDSALAAGSSDSPKAALEQRFADFALALRYEVLPADVIQSVKRVLLDTLGCAFGSVGSDPANIAETTIRKTFGEGNTATVIGYPRPATIEGALFVNGVLVRSLDLNDTYIGTEPLHPSEVLPTAIALCEGTQIHEFCGSGRWQGWRRADRFTCRWSRRVRRCPRIDRSPKGKRKTESSVNLNN